MPIGDENDPDTPIYNEVLHGVGGTPDGHDHPAVLAEQRGFEIGQGIVRMSQIIQATMAGVSRGMAEAQKDVGDDQPHA